MRLSTSSSRFLIFAIGLFILWASGRFFCFQEDTLEKVLAGYPLYVSGAVFVFLYVAVTFFVWFSKDIFRLVGALLFGAYLSTLLVCIAEIGNAVILFNCSRYAGRQFIEGVLKTEKLRAFDERIAKANALWLFIFRTTPLFPLRFFDIASGLTKISFRRFFTVILLGTPPRIFWLQCILAGVGKAVFTDPSVVSVYLRKHPSLFLLSAVYLILIGAVIAHLHLPSRRKQRSQRCGGCR